MSQSPAKCCFLFRCICHCFNRLASSTNIDIRMLNQHVQLYMDVNRHGVPRCRVHVVTSVGRRMPKKVGNHRSTLRYMTVRYRIESMLQSRFAHCYLNIFSPHMHSVHQREEKFFCVRKAQALNTGRRIQNYEQIELFPANFKQQMFELCRR